MSDDQTPAEEFNEVADAAAEELLALRAENQALKDQILRIAADAENTKRRTEREANDARAYAIQKFGRDLLTVADTLSRALASPHEGADPALKNFVLGMEMTEKALQTAFESNGLKKIDPAKGEKFDPHKHQAMMEQPGSDVAPGAVIQVLQPGYELLGRLVRPAMVVVAPKAAGAPKPDGGANPYGGGGEDPDSGGSVDTRA